MALLTNKDITKELDERLSEFTQFGMILNHMLDINKIDITDLEKVFLEKDREKAIFLYSNILKKIEQNDIDKSFDVYSKKYTNEDSLSGDKYYTYLNNKCINSILTKISSLEAPIDRTYINTYNYLLETNYDFRK